MQPEPQQEHITQLQRFYRLQSRFYDLTRWCFLFGRHGLLEQVKSIAISQNVLEVGCGTGTNMQKMARLFPAANLTGVDVSLDMLQIAERKLQPWRERVELRSQVFDDRFVTDRQPDLILFSYSLSMMNPGWEVALQMANELLTANGLIAVVDFDDTPSILYRRYMSSYHVRMDGHLLPALVGKFKTIFAKEQRVYAGLWRYFQFVGRKQEG